MPAAGEFQGSGAPQVRCFSILYARLRGQRIKASVQRIIRKYQSAETVFSRVYEKGAWEGRGERFYSGSGSDDGLAVPYANTIADELADATHFERIVDLGCGDFRVGRLLLERLPVSYVGVDVVPSLIAHHRDRFESDRVSFIHQDIAGSDPLPSGDYCLVRQVLQHLSNSQVLATLSKLRSFRRVFITEHYPANERGVIPNLDKVHGSDVRAPQSGLYFDQPPFNLRIRELLSVPWAPRGSKDAAKDVVKTFEVFWP